MENPFKQRHRSHIDIDMNLVVAFTFILLQSFDVNVVFASRISIDKCEYYRYTLPLIPEVFSGTDEDAAPKEFPFMARIVDGDQYLNGILVSENFVLTLASRDHGTDVILGDLDMATKKDDAHAQTFKIIGEFTHPNYKTDSPFDLKLLKLNASVNIDDYIRPACLPHSKDDEISEDFYEVGWSETNVRKNTLLHKVKLYGISNEFCKDRFKWIAHQKPMMERLDEKATFCATSVDGDRDMCLGFFGAALLNRNTSLASLNEVIGLATTNTGCDDTYPTVFVRISKSLSWIEAVVWPDEVPSENVTTTTSTQSSITVPTTQSSITVPTTHRPLTNTSTISIHITTTKNSLIFLSIAIALAILVLIGCVATITFRMQKSKPDVSVNITMSS